MISKFYPDSLKLAQGTRFSMSDTKCEFEMQKACLK